MKWSFVWSALAVFWCTTAFGQSAESRPIVQVGAQILTTKDLERVKQLLPFERFKTTLGKTRLIDAIYMEYMIVKAKLEQSGMVKATADDVARSVALLEESGAQTEIKAAGYSLDAFAERELITRNYLSLTTSRTLSNIMGNFLETYANPLKVDQKNLPASHERDITSRYSLNPSQSQSPLYVTLRSMLLESTKRAAALAPKIRSERDFDAVARRYSIVRRDVGGSYTSEYLPSRLTMRELEPELQIGVLQASKLGLLRVAAPFGRVWLVWLSALPKAPVAPGLIAGFSINLVAGSDLSAVQVLLKFTALPVSWLGQTLEPLDPVTARVGSAELRLSEFFVASILEETDFRKLLNGAFFDLTQRSFLGQYVEQWLEQTARGFTIWRSWCGIWAAPIHRGSSQSF